MENDDTVATVADPNAPTVGVATGADRSSIGPTGLTRYRLGAVLGKGGMGEVISAEDAQIGRQVAVKRMRAAEPTADATARFLREAKIQGRLDHPAIVPVHELATDTAGAPFFVMKQLAGVTLATVLEQLAAADPKTVREFPRQRLLRAFAEVCLAIEFAHTRGIVHRDLKPSNIVLGDFGEVYVLDWGIAKVAGELRPAFADVSTLDTTETLEGSVLGTPGYMSPEQVEGGAELDGRADVYALGCILFELLALAPLHPRGRDGLASALAGRAAKPSKIAPDRDIPPELDAVCALATAPLATRTATARALGDAVQRFLDGDRDLAARTQLAREALVTARAELATDPLDTGNRAMRAAGRAVALDPRLAEAAELVFKLMVEPPTRTPPEVEDAIERADIEAQLATRRLMVLSGVVYLGFVPIGIWAGFHDWWLIGPITVLSAMMLTIGLCVTHRTLTVFSWAAVAIHLTTITLIAVLTSPFLLGPALAVTTAMSISTMTRLANRWVLAAIFCLPVLGVWALQATGVLTQTTAIDGNRYILTSAAETLDPTGAQVSLLVFTVLVIGTGVLMMREQIDDRRASLRRSELVAWKLKQLVG